MINIDFSDVAALENKLKRLQAASIPFAIGFTVNEAAFQTRKLYVAATQEKLILRNKWTERNIRVEKGSPRKPISRVGSLLEYMEKQEFGGTEVKKGKEGVPIPTSYAARLPENQRPRTKRVTAPHRLSRIQLRRVSVAANRRRQNAIAISQAARSGNKMVFLDLGNKKGIFRIVGGVRKPRIKMLWDLTEQSVTIPKTPLLKPSVDIVQQQIPSIYFNQLEKQIDRIK